MLDQPIPEDPQASVRFEMEHAEELSRIAW
jgi:hypothetical protein